MERKDQLVSLDRWQRSRVVGKVEVEVAGSVGSGIQARLERIARKVKRNQAPHSEE